MRSCWHTARMTAAPTALPDLDGLNAAGLKALILVQHEQLLSHRSEIEHLKLLIAKLRRMQFGRKSEKLDRQIEQLELKLEELESAKAARVGESASPSPVPPSSSLSTAAKPARQPLPEHLPREVRTYAPKQAACTECGGRLRPLGEDISEVLEYVPARFKVIRQIRPKLSCATCERIAQAPAPSRPIERGLAGPGLLAHVLVAKYCDHQPLYRQAEMYAREGVELERSTLADWVGGSSRLLEPLVEALRRHVMSAGKLHADDTPVPVLAPGNGRPRRDGCGRMCGMIVQQVRTHRQQCGLLTRLIAEVNILGNICATSAAPCRPMPTPGSIIFMTAATFRKQPAGPTCGASSTICRWRMLLR